MANFRQISQIFHYINTLTDDIRDGDEIIKCSPSPRESYSSLL